jgi:hypothetical protein
MNWLALSPGEVSALWIAASALAFWLYLHSRRPLRHRVSTLRFWNSAQGAPSLHRRWLREPWAFLAQVILLLLLIAALANPHWGRQDESRNIVIVLDTSIWSQVQPPGESPWIDEIRMEARRALDSLPSDDRVLLLRAEPDALPILPSTSDRSALKRAIAEITPTSVVANLPGALELDRAVLTGSRRGLLIYIGPGFVDESQKQQLDEFRRRLAESGGAETSPQFLVRLVGDPALIQNRGITELALRRDSAHPDQWSVLTEVRNYGDAQASAVLNLSVGGKTLQRRSLALAPGEVRKIQDELVWSEGGFLQAEITPSDALDADNRAAVEIPSSRPVRVAVYSARSTFARDLGAVLAANPYLSMEFLAAGAPAPDRPDVAIYAGVNPPAHAAANSIWFVTGPARASSTPVRIVNWDSEHPVTRWIRTRDVSVRNPVLLTLQADDIVLASAEGNPPTPLIVAREQGGRKMLILGFDPQNSNLQFESAFPLLMAGSIEWLTQPVEDVAQSAFTGHIDLRSPAAQVVAPSGNAVPFERAGSDLHFFASEAGIYRLIEPNREKDIAVNVPSLPQQQWSPTLPEEAPIEPEPIRDAGRELWRWLVALAIIPLWLEWWLFYSGRGVRKVEVKTRVSANAEPPRIESSDDLTLGLSRRDAEARHHQLIK